MFSVRCHQDLTHRIGLKPVDAAFEVFYKMKAYCDALDAPFLVLETPVSQVLDAKGVAEARDFFSSVSPGKIQLVWEYRAPFTEQVGSLMQDFGIVQSVDLSLKKPTVPSDVAYSRLFGKGKHNIYQFTDEELLEIRAKSRGNPSQNRRPILPWTKNEHRRRKVSKALADGQVFACDRLFRGRVGEGGFS